MSTQDTNPMNVVVLHAPKAATLAETPTPLGLKGESKSKIKSKSKGVATRIGNFVAFTSSRTRLESSPV